MPPQSAPPGAPAPRRRRLEDGSQADDVDVEDTEGFATTTSVQSLLDAMQHRLENQIRGIETTMVSTIKQVEQVNNARFSKLEADTAALSRRQSATDESHKSMQADIDRIKESLALAESSVPMREQDTNHDQNFYRTVDTTIIRINTEYAVAKASIAGLVNNILDRASIAHDQITLQGDDINKKFTVQFKANADLARRRVEKFMGLMRENGTWLSWDVKRPQTQGKSKVYFSRDKNPQQTKREMDGKKFLEIWKRHHSDLKLHFSRVDGVFSHNWVPVARLDTAPGSDPSSLNWNQLFLEGHTIDTDAMETEYKSAATREVQTAQWI